jgi:uracil phosphoribosyltransferase
MSNLPSNVHISRHPCLRAKLSQLRSKSTNARETKELVHEISLILGTEALAGLDVAIDGAVRDFDSAWTYADGSNQDESPIGFQYDFETISPQKITIVPILRSGLGMLDGEPSDSLVAMC